MAKTHRILFAGTPNFAEQHLKRLIEEQYEVIGVLTQPDKPTGRGRKLTQSPVKKLALEYNIPVYQPKTLGQDPAIIQTLTDLKPDVMVVVAYGLIIPTSVLNIPKHGCINVHGSILPSWRGAAPVQRAIMSGEKITGATIMQMDAGLDTGDILRIVRISILNTDTTSDVLNKLVTAGNEGLNRVFENLGNLKPQKQNNELATYARKISKSEGKINWNKTSIEISCHIRAMVPWPVAWTVLDNTTIRCWGVNISEEQLESNEKPGTIIKATSDGLVISCHKSIMTLTHIQLPGKKAMPVSEVLKSKQEFFAVGRVFQ